MTIGVLKHADLAWRRQLNGVRNIHNCILILLLLNINVHFSWSN